jgi:hypothetical protein
MNSFFKTLNMSIVVGSKMLYCKVENDKSTEEEVEILYIQTKEEGCYVIIFVPSINRDRYVVPSRLYPIKETK